MSDVDWRSFVRLQLTISCKAHFVSRSAIETVIPSLIDSLPSLRSRVAIDIHRGLIFKQRPRARKPMCFSEILQHRRCSRRCESTVQYSTIRNPASKLATNLLVSDRPDPIVRVLVRWFSHSQQFVGGLRNQSLQRLERLLKHRVPRIPECDGRIGRQPFNDALKIF